MRSGGPACRPPVRRYGASVTRSTRWGSSPATPADTSLVRSVPRTGRSWSCCRRRSTSTRSPPRPSQRHVQSWLPRGSSPRRAWTCSSTPGAGAGGCTRQPPADRRRRPRGAARRRRAACRRRGPARGRARSDARLSVQARFVSPVRTRVAGLYAEGPGSSPARLRPAACPSSSATRAGAGHRRDGVSGSVVDPADRVQLASDCPMAVRPVGCPRGRARGSSSRHRPCGRRHGRRTSSWRAGDHCLTGSGTLGTLCECSASGSTSVAPRSLRVS